MIVKYKWYSSITIIKIILILPTILASNEKCTAKNGVCKDVSVSKCTGDHAPISNLCDESTNIKCCVPIVKTDVDTFIEKLINVEMNYETRYAKSGIGQPLKDQTTRNNIASKILNKNESWTNEIINAPDNSFAFDCCGLIKSILWGWNGDMSKSYGGAIYESNTVPDINADAMCSNDYSTDYSENFDIIEEGEIVCMNQHIGVYIGNDKVIESTPSNISKDSSGVQISNLKERKTLNGEIRGKWKFHKHFNFINYNKCACAANTSSYTNTTNISNNLNSVDNATCNCNTKIDDKRQPDDVTISDNNLNTNNEAKKICKSSIKSFIETNECFISYNTMDDDNTKIDFEKCKILNNEKCQNLIKIKFENIGNVIPECKDIDGSDEFEEYDEIFVDFYSIKNSVLACSMDENNKLCPFTIFYRSEFEDEDEDEDEGEGEHKSFNEAIKESCKSKRCTDSLKDYFEYLKITYDEDDDDQVREKKSFEYLYSNECTSQILNSDNDSNSDKDSNNISDNNLNTSGFEKITIFPYQYLSCLLMLIFTWWIYTSH